MSQELEGQEGEVDQEVLNEAADLGWVPLDKFKGDPDKWVDAHEFVERGRNIMPILRKNNDRLRADLLKRDTEIGTLRASLLTMGKTLEKLETNYNEGMKRALKQQEADLRRQLIEARKDDDVDEEVRLQTQLDDVRAASAEADKLKPTKIDVAPPNDPEANLSPEFKKWKADNPWFGTDRKKTKAIIRAAEDLREEGETLEGAAFFEMAAERAFKEETPSRNKVESGSPRGTGSGTGARGKGYASLPKEAQDACMQDVDLFVGPGKKFKELKDWQAYYTKVYHGEPV